MKEPLVFKNFEEMRAFFKTPHAFEEPERIEEVKDEVSPKPSNKRKPKADAAKMGESAKDKD